MALWVALSNQLPDDFVKSITLPIACFLHLVATCKANNIDDCKKIKKINRGMITSSNAGLISKFNYSE
jgi:hypothetical protein